MSLIDWAKVCELRDEVGAEDFDEVVELFLEEVDEKIAHLGQSQQSTEHDLHFLKGSALNLGFVQFSELCRVGEEMASQGNGDSVDLPEIIESYRQSKNMFIEGLQTKLAC